MQANNSGSQSRCQPLRSRAWKNHYDACATRVFDGFIFGHGIIRNLRASQLARMRRETRFERSNKSKFEVTGELIASAISPFGVAVDATLAEQIRTFTKLLLLWHEKVGLTTITEPREILERHFGESFFGARAVPISHGRLADVGSGAGFPGLAIKLLVPQLEVILIESNNRKAAFLGEVIRRLKLSGVRVEAKPFTELPGPSPRFDYICSRALGNVKNLLEWSIGAFTPDGRLALWLGRKDAQEIASHPGWMWTDPISIPHSKQRVILVGVPAKE